MTHHLRAGHFPAPSTSTAAFITTIRMSTISSASATQHADASQPRCIICLESNCNLSYTCQHGHSACDGCLERCVELRLRLDDSSRHPYQCPGRCTDTFTWEHLPVTTCAHYRKDLNALLHRHEHPNTMTCPNCTMVLRTDGPNFPNLQCTGCQTQCCYFHGMSIFHCVT
jgi:hypothetical protein